MLLRGARYAVAVLLLLACSEADSPPADREGEAERQRLAAVEMLRRRDPDAYLAFRAVPPQTKAGRLARQDLRRADALYREGIRRLDRGEDEAARDRFERARAIAPIDPRLYRPLGEAYLRRGRRTGNPADYERGADYLRKGIEYFERRPPGAGPSVQPRPAFPWAPVAVGLALLLAAAALLLARLRRGETLEELVAKSPEMHPQIAYLAGALRHELLKHRIGAVSDALAALRTSRTSLPEIDYLAGRLFGGEPIAKVWESHVDGFERASGGRLNLRWRDRMFRRAGRALRAIGRMRREFAKPTPRLVRRLSRRHAEVRAFDHWLESVADRLTLAQVDAALLREVVYAVQQEHVAGAVHIDEIRHADVPADVHVEVFRTDLVIVLKNVVRNAILAMAEEPPRRALGLQVRLEAEPTGEESVVIVVSDTSRAPLSTESIYERKLDRGLGLVTAALERYNGSISVEPGADGFRKGVALRFFRALREEGR